MQSPTTVIARRVYREEMEAHFVAIFDDETAVLPASTLLLLHLTGWT